MPKNAHGPRGGAGKKTSSPAPGPSKDAPKTELKGGKKGQSVAKAEDGKATGAKPTTKSGAAAKAPEGAEDAPKKPDTRTLIGGASWTGKLPLNLLSEVCQKQKWHKPDYTMTRTPDGYISTVILTYKNPKTNETTTLPPFKVPNAHRSIAAEPSAVEARHFAAAYTLFRISSMKNTHMMMPPKYKDLWKGIFTDIKKEEVAEGKAWMYEADPFATAKAREEEEKARAKRREEEARLKAKAQEAGNKNNIISGPGSKAWERAPQVEMGKRVRLDVEALIRESTIWNAHGIEIAPNEKARIVNDITKLGFRKSHVQEAVELCKDQKEVLEWLLIHVPEDDLPSWSLPENYIAGVSMASSDLKREAMIKRLAATGYALDLCEEELDAHAGDERCAASALQSRLLYGTEEQDASSEVEIKNLCIDSAQAQGEWDEEQAVLTSIYGERCTLKDADSIQIVLQPEGIKNIIITLQLQKPLRNYPHELPIVSIQAALPAYIRLSITKQALLHAKSSLLGEAMIFNLVDWLEQNIAKTVENPGQLSAVSSASAAGEVRPSKHGTRRRKRAMPAPINWTPGSQESQDLLAAWRATRSSESQKGIMAKRRSLPAWQMQVSIMQAVSDNPVTIITGETGSGKSTQAVQFVLDDLIQRNLGAVANIICTQPRRISALGLADRVAEERGGTVGEEVGYIIRGDTKIRKGVTKLTFVTTGVLLRRLQTSGGSEKDIDAALADVSHVFVDEVHERGVDADFLLVLLKAVLRRRKDLRVILMSATVDAEGFVGYFSEVGTVARVHVEGRTFPVTDFYKDDVIRMTGYGGSQDDDAEEEMDDKAVSTALRASGMKVDYNLIAKTVEHIDRELGSDEGGILVFLPGAMEIDRTLQALGQYSHLHALPLHASLPPAQQRRVFPPAPRGTRKVIAATNVAETSITIPDVVAVIDTGRVKETSYDPATSMVKLSETWASKAACKQRRGRAGRVQKGICYKLFTRNAEFKMRERPDPEILRVPLEQLCLSVMSMGITNVASFLASALTPPSSGAIDSALELLTRVGAIDDGELTALGKHLALIPADLKCAKLLVLGCTFGCVNACLDIAALLTARSPFLNPRDKRDEVKKVRFDFAPGQGDLISDLRAYEAWVDKRRKLNNRDLRFWCEENFISSQALRDVEANRAQFLTALKEIGFLPLSYPSSSGASSWESDALNTHGGNSALVRSIIAASLHPNVLRIDFPSKKFAASHTGTVELDPEARTIRFFAQDGSRGFVHPSSASFDARGWSSDVRFLCFWERMTSGEGDRQRAWARGITPCNSLAVLLFGGNLALDTLGRGVVVDGWIRLRGWARIGVLVSRLRGLLDDILDRRVDNPQGDLGEHAERVLAVVRRLVERDGLDR